MKEKNLIKGVVFDMDGVMFDTERLAIPAWIYAGKEIGCEITEKMVIETFGLNKENTRRFYETYFKNTFDFETALKIRTQYAQKEIEKNGVPVKKGLLALLEYLKQNGYLFTMATSSHEQKVRQYLKMAHIDNYFGDIVCGDKIEKGKPAPDIYLKACAILNIAPKHCIAIEDSAPGIISAYDAGMKPVLIPDVLNPKGVEAMVYKTMDSLLDVICYLKKQD